jgi:hypothetical protein
MLTNRLEVLKLLIQNGTKHTQKNSKALHKVNDRSHKC